MLIINVFYSSSAVFFFNLHQSQEATFNYRVLFRKETSHVMNECHECCYHNRRPWLSSDLEQVLSFFSITE